MIEDLGAEYCIVGIANPFKTERHGINKYQSNAEMKCVHAK